MKALLICIFILGGCTTYEELEEMAVNCDQDCDHLWDELERRQERREEKAAKEAIIKACTSQEGIWYCESYGIKKDCQCVSRDFIDRTIYRF